MKINTQLIMAISLILLVVLSRLIPHPPNFTPVGAIAVFCGGFILDKRLYLLPILALLISDILLGFYNLTSMLFVYIAFGSCIALGYFFLSKKRNMMRIGIAGLLSAGLFFVISNFGVWLSGQLYPLTIAGLVQNYVMAIPFFGNTILSNLCYLFILYGLYCLLEQKQVSVINRHQV